MSTAVTPPRATLDDLLRVEGKAELVNGQVIELIPTGHRPNVVAGRVFRKLADHIDTVGAGVAYTDNMGFNVPMLTSGRESFSPDAAYYSGPLPTDPMRFVDGAPDFAVEVRSDWDYGSAAEVAMADKRADYFEAGTRVVWDVDPIGRVVRRYRPGEATPTVFAAGEEADAEPAVPGWRVAVDRLMRSS
jgi:Uma2 family endonuclease